MDGRREGAVHHRLRSTEEPDHLMRDCGAVRLHCLFYAHCHPTHIAERRRRANDALRTAQRERARLELSHLRASSLIHCAAYQLCVNSGNYT